MIGWLKRLFEPLESQQQRDTWALRDIELIVEQMMRYYGKAAGHDAMTDEALRLGQVVALRLGDKGWSERMRLRYAPNRFIEADLATAAEVR